MYLKQLHQRDENILHKLKIAISNYRVNGIIFIIFHAIHAKKLVQHI